MLGIDLGTRIIKVNVSKVRKDHDFYGDVQVPVTGDAQASSDPFPAGAFATTHARTTRPTDKGMTHLCDQNEVVPDGSTDFSHVYWDCVTKGKTDLLELFSGSARVSECAALAGLKVGPPIDLRTGFDLRT